MALLPGLKHIRKWLDFGDLCFDRMRQDHHQVLPVPARFPGKPLASQYVLETGSGRDSWAVSLAALKARKHDEGNLGTSPGPCQNHTRTMPQPLQNHPQPHRNCQEVLLKGHGSIAARSSQEQPKATSSQEQPGEARSSHHQPARDCGAQWKGNLRGCH